MDEKTTFVVLITIDCSERMGATSVYGTSELEHIIRNGAESRGYKNVVVSQVDTEIKVSGRCPLTATIS